MMYIARRLAVTAALIVCILMIVTGAQAEYIRESNHPYNNGQNTDYFFRVEGAEAVALTFSNDTYVESGYDFIEIRYRTADNAYAPIGEYRFTGSALQGKTILVPSNGGTISLDSDSSKTYYGFRASIRALTGDEIAESMFKISSQGTITKFYGLHRDEITELNIPETIGGVTVTSIGSDVFKDCNSLKRVRIPDTVTSIGSSAFYSCDQLESVYIPEGVTSFGFAAFANCISLESIAFPASLSSFGSNTFEGCTSLKSVDIPESVNLTGIGFRGFKDCTSLKSVKIPASVTYINEEAFSGCSSLESIIIPERVKTIDADVFANTYNLKYILFRGWNDIEIADGAIPYSAVLYAHEYSYIDSWATESKRRIVYIDDLGESDVISISLPSVLNLIVGETAVLEPGFFPDVENPKVSWSSSSTGVVSVTNGKLTAKAAGKATITASIGSVRASCTVTVRTPDTLYLPASLKNIMAEAFEGTSAEKIVIFGKTVNIGDRAFADCRNLKVVVIPNSVTSISETAFEGSTGVSFLCKSNNAAAKFAAGHGIPYSIE